MRRNPTYIRPCSFLPPTPTECVASLRWRKIYHARRSTSVQSGDFPRLKRTTWYTWDCYWPCADSHKRAWNKYARASRFYDSEGPSRGGLHTCWRLDMHWPESPLRRLRLWSKPWKRAGESARSGG